MIKICLPLAAGALVLAGCSSSSGGSGAKYAIGFQAGLSGSNSQLGINERDGAQLAVEQANAAHVLPYKIDFVTSDDEASQPKSVAAAQKLIDDSKVVAVVGPSFSGPTKAAEPNYAEAKLATITPSATNPHLTDASNGFTAFLRGAPNDNAQGGGMADYYAKKLHLKKVFVVDDASEYGVGLATVAKTQLQQLGVQVVTDSVPAGTPDYGPEATKVKNSGADGLIYAGYYQDAAPFAKKLKEAGFTGAKISGDGTEDPKFIQLAGDASEGWYLTCPCADANVAPATQQFAKDYEARWHTPPSTYSAESFDIANMIIQEMKTYGTAKITRADLLAKLRTATYTGLTKTFSFQPNGEFAGNGVFLYTVTGGKIVYQGNIEDEATS